MAAWVSVVKHPLGLSGFALALMFGLLAQYGPTGEFSWLAPVAVAAACVALSAGLLLARRSVGKRKTAQPQAAGDSSSKATTVQTTLGAQSPAISNTQGPVTINFGNTDNSKKS